MWRARLYDTEERQAFSRGSPSGAGNNDPATMITLCLSCHARVSRTFYVQDDWPEFLRVLWREQHPEGNEQGELSFATFVAAISLVMPVAQCVQLLKNARRSALIVSACVVGIPCGKSL